MSRNRLKKGNGIQTKRLWKLVAICTMLTLFGVVYVWMQLQLIKLADENKKLELVRDDVRKKNDGLQLQITRLKNAVVLQQKLNRFNIVMVPVSSLPLIPAKLSPQPLEEYRQLARAEENR